VRQKVTLTLKSRRCSRRRPSLRPRYPSLEPLETRTVPSVADIVSQLPLLDQSQYNDILGAPQESPQHGAQLLALQQVSVPSATLPVHGAWVKGLIRPSTTDVNWYSFTLDHTATVTLTTLDPPGSALTSVISLYNNDPDAVFDNSLANGGFMPAPNDPLDPLGHRLLTQVQGTTAVTSLVQELAAGTYFVAVSGAGNRYFHPFVADSGFAGSSGAFALVVEADNVADPVGPTVLTSDPSNGAVMPSSPLVLRVDFDRALDPSTLNASTVLLEYSADGSFSVITEPYALRLHFSPDANELQASPSAPLEAGYYRLVLTGSGASGSVIADLQGDALGQVDPSLGGEDTVIGFHVIGSEGSIGGGLGGDDTSSTAHNLGNITAAGLVQVTGAIGDDPYYSFFDPNNSDPLSPNFQLPTNYAGADVDMYHFTISGPGSYIVRAEVFAGRIGSPLDSGVSLFQVQGGQLVRLTANDNTLNSTQTQEPIFTFDMNGNPIVDYGSALPFSQDSAINAGLTAGDYYVAVSSGANTPDPAVGLDIGANGVVFDPNQGSHSGQSGINDANGFTIGPYVLNLRVDPNPGAPHVVSVKLHESPSTGSPYVTSISPGKQNLVNGPPDQLVVQFDQAMNVQQLAFIAYHQTTQDTLSAVYFHGPDGYDYYPQFDSYDPTTFTATFDVKDALPNGINQLILAPNLGLTNLGGTPLTGNRADGDYTITFSLQNSGNPSNNGPLVLLNQPGHDDPSNPQVLGPEGVLFPAMQAAGISVIRDFSNAPPNSISDTADYYEFTVTQSRQYTLSLTGSNLPPGTVPILEPTSNVFFSPPLIMQINGTVIEMAFLQPGTYLVHLGGWSSTLAQSVKYQLYFTIGQQGDNATPLTVSAAPALSIRLVDSGLTTTPIVVLPTNPGISPVGFSNTNLSALANLLPTSLSAIGAIGSNGSGGGSASNAGGTLAQTASSSLMSSVLELIVLTQVGAGDATIGGGATVAWLDSFVAPVRNSWSQALDFLFRLGGWSDAPGVSAPHESYRTNSGSDDTEMEDADSSEAIATPDEPFAWPGGAEDSGWACAVAALVLYQGETRRQRTGGRARGSATSRAAGTARC
jgi:hypothetical protein